MKRVQKDGYGTARCPKCHGVQFVSKKTLLGYIVGGIFFAPQRLKCVSCSTVLKHA